MTMYDGRTNLSRQVIDQVEQHLPQMLYKTVIPRSHPARGSAQLRPHHL